MIEIENLGKRYHVRGASASYVTLRESLVSATRKLVPRKVSPEQAESRATFWALRDLNVRVDEGDVLGVIGSNGSGKTTLLKVISRITPPTEGLIRLKGRVGSLLEVGTGFHPELTGRENVFLNGAILGMERRDIEKRFDEIIEFAGVERFVDTPVKHYSSGMHVRLAFSVAAHLDPEILLVDEVLAVGDAAFQRKCLDTLKAEATGGRTVLFVSHNISAVRRLCTKAIWLTNGTVQQIGDAEEVCDSYLESQLRAEVQSGVREALESLPEDPAMRLTDIVLTQDGVPKSAISNDKTVDINVSYVIKTPTNHLRIYFDLLSEEGDVLIRTFHDELDASPSTLEAGNYLSKATIPANLLAPTTYELRVRATIFNVRSCTGDGVGLPLRVERANAINAAYPAEPVRAKLQPLIEWETTRVAP